MTDHKSDPPSTSAPQTFKAVLTPHRSLGSTGFVLMMAAIGVVSFIAGMAFLMMGAWPVMGFFGLDVLLIYWAFRQNYRDGRSAETIEVTTDKVIFTRIDPAGNETTVDFNTYWVRLALDERSDGRSHLSFVMREEKTRIADFLSDGERREFADVLASELSAARSLSGFR
jgi:uncharacterized membrane protein